LVQFENMNNNNNVSIKNFPQDLTSYALGNSGIPYVHSFDSGQPGPHVMVNCLTHGNELCGLKAATSLLDHGIRPRTGRLTLSFANIAAYARYDLENPQASRFVDRDFNRLWQDRVIDNDITSTEAARARELRPLIRDVDALLDLHSTTYCRKPFFAFPDHLRPRALAKSLTSRLARVVLKPGGMKGTTLMEYDHFMDTEREAAALVAECGQHWDASSGDIALDVTLDFLIHFNVIRQTDAYRIRPTIKPKFGSSVTYHITQDIYAKTGDFHYVRQFVGFDPVKKGEIVAWDGDKPVRAPHADCVVVLVRPNVKKGGEAMSFGRLVS
jgi:predicted deacylase